MSEEVETIPVHPFATEPARVRVSKGRTIALAQYESARLDVMIEVPCYVELVADTYRSVLATVDRLIGEEVDKIIGPQNKKDASFI